MAPVYGYATQLGIDTASPVTHRFDFQSEDLVCDEDFLDLNGLRGTRSRAGERVRAGVRRVHGPVVLQPTAAELALLLPWVTGGTPSGSPTVTYPLADALSTRFVEVDRGSKVFTYSGCAVDRCTIRGGQNQPIVITLDLVGQDETVGNSGTFPALSLDTGTNPFVFTDLALTVNGTTYSAPSFEMVIDNAIDKERFFNSQTLTAVNPTDRHVTLSTELPYGDASAVYNLGSGGTAVTAIFTDGGAVLTLSLARVTFPRHSPMVRGRQEVMLPMQGTAYKSGSTLELIATLNPGP